MNADRATLGVKPGEAPEIMYNGKGSMIWSGEWVKIGDHARQRGFPEDEGYLKRLDKKVEELDEKTSEDKASSSQEPPQKDD